MGYKIYLLNQEGSVVQLPISSIISSKVNKELNSADSFEMEWTGEGYTSGIDSLTTGIMVKDQDDDIIFGGRVISVDKDMYGMYKVSGEGALSYLNDYVVEPFQINGDGWTSGQYVKELYRYIYYAYSNVSVEGTQTWNYLDMDVSYCYQDSTTSAKLANVGSEEFMTCLEAFKTKLLSNTGLYCDVVYEAYEDYFVPKLYVKTYAQMQSECGQTIEIGSNLLDCKLNADYSEIVTRLIPLGKKTDLSKYKVTGGRVNIRALNNNVVYIQNNDAMAQYGTICKTKYYNNTTNESNLLRAATEYLYKHSTPTYTLELTAFDLHTIDSDIDKFKVGSVVPVQIQTLSFVEDMVVDSIEYDLINPENSKVNFGNKITRYEDRNRNNFAEVNEQLAEYSSSIVQNKEVLDVETFINEGTVETPVVSEGTLTGTLNGVSITATLISNENIKAGDVVVENENKYYIIDLDDYTEDERAKILTSSLGKLVSANDIVATNVFANKIFSQEITAQHFNFEGGRIGTDVKYFQIDSAYGLVGKKVEDGVTSDTGIIVGYDYITNYSGNKRIDIENQLISFSDGTNAQPIALVDGKLKFNDVTTMTAETETLKVTESLEVVDGPITFKNTTWNNLFKTKEFSATSASISGSSYLATTISNCTMDGYTPIGLVGARTSSNHGTLVRFSFSGTTATIGVRNVSTSAITPTVYATVLFIKTI